jgi:polyphosphate kinase
MAKAPLPAGLAGGDAALDFFRDVYFDTPDADLERKGATCRLRVEKDGGRSLMVEVFDREVGHGVVLRARSEADVPETDPPQLFRGASEPARLLRALIDPSRLEVSLEVETRRWIRGADFTTDVAEAAESSSPEVRLCYDSVTVRGGERTGEFWSLELTLPDGGPENVPGLIDDFMSQYGIRVTLADVAGQAHDVLDALQVSELEERVRSARQVAVVAHRNGEVALRRTEQGLRFPTRVGHGPEVCRRTLRDFFGTTRGRARIAGVAPGLAGRPALEVWLAEEVQEHPEDGEPDKRVWLPLDTVFAMVGSRGLRDPATLAALHVLARAVPSLPSAPSQGAAEEGAETTGVAGKRQRRPEAIEFAMPEPPPDTHPQKHDRPTSDQLLNMELGRMAFDERILAFAENRENPLLERVRFLSMFAARLDDVFMTRAAKFKDQIVEGSSEPTQDGLSPVEQLDLMGLRARQMTARAYRLLRTLLDELKEHGIRVMRWDDLDPADRLWLAEHYATQVEAVLTPFVSDASHPFPHLQNLRPSVAALVRLPGSRVEYFTAVELPEELPRFVTLPGGKCLIPLEEVVAANLPHVHSGLEVVEAHPFRVTRAARIQLGDDDASSELLPIVAEKVQERAYRPVVRIEVEEGMPDAMRQYLLRELRYEIEDTLILLDEEDVYSVPWLVGLTDLGEVAKVQGVEEELRFSPIERASPLPEDQSIFTLMREKDWLVHFPYDDFGRTVGRLLEEAADDPDVLAVKLTLYRLSDSSRIIESLRRARANGKDAVATVELKATFDEARNIEFARSLEQSGIHVVFSPARYKVHAKTVLVVRREAGGLRRYAYVGTGNLNESTAATYVDLGLFTADPGITEDVNRVFNVLTAYSAGAETDHVLVSPFNMRRRLLEMFEREVQHCHAGRPARIRIQLNGLTDTKVIAALYAASQAGVPVDLTVREICSLRPQVPRLSETIHVKSLLGRFLQHARIFAFENGGEPEFFIGSSDLRPRNLDERVELVVPVRDPAHQEVLDRILRDTFHDPNAWTLTPAGTYVRRDESVGGAPVRGWERAAARVRAKR